MNSLQTTDNKMSSSSSTTSPIPICKYISRQGDHAGRKCVSKVSKLDPCGCYCSVHYKVRGVVREATAQNMEKEIATLTEKLRVSELARETLQKAYMRLSMEDRKSVV